MRKFNFLISILLIPASIYAAFEEMPSGARALALSKTFSARTDSVYSVYFNPAGLAFIKELQFAAEYGKNLIGLDDASAISGGNALFSVPIGPRSPRAATNKTFFTLGTAYQTLMLADTYSESILQAVFGVPVTSEVGIGISVKSLQQRYIISGNKYYDDDPVLQKSAGTSVVDSDFGVIVKPLDNLSAGVSISNFLGKKYGISDNDQTRLESSQHIGLLYEESRLNIALEVQRRSYTNGTQQSGLSTKEKIRYSAAAEKTIGLFVFRGGFNWAGTADVKNITAGVGFNTGRFEVDYGWSFPLSGIEDTSGNHSFSILLKFGKISAPEKKQALKEKNLTEICQPYTSTGVSAVPLKTFSAVAPGSVSTSVPVAQYAVSAGTSAPSAQRPVDISTKAAAQYKIDASTKVPPVSLSTAAASMANASQSQTALKLPGIIAPSTSTLKMPQLKAGELALPEVTISSGVNLPAAAELKPQQPLSASKAPALPSLPAAASLPTAAPGTGLPGISLPSLPGGEKGAHASGTGGGVSAKSVPGAGAGVVSGVPGVAAAPVVVPVPPTAVSSAPVQGLTPAGKKATIKAKTALATPHLKTAPAGRKFVPPEITPTPQRIYRVGKDETLYSLAQKFYGDKGKWVKIYEANKDKIEKGIVKPGQKLVIP